MLKVTVPSVSGHPEIPLRGKPAVIAWAKGELEFWEPLAQGRGHWPHPGLFNWDSASQSLRRVLELVDRSQDADVEPTVTQAANALGLLSTDPRAAFLKTLRARGEEDKVIGAVRLAFLFPGRLGELVQHQTIEWWDPATKGVALAAAFEAVGRESGAADLRVAFTVLEGHMNGALDAHHHELAAAEQARERLVLETGEAVATAQATLGDFLEGFRQKLEAALGALESEVKALRERYERELALRAPMEYWSEKAAEHKSEAGMYRWWFTGILAVGVLVLGGIATFWLVPLLKGIQTSSATGPLWPIILFSMLAAVWAWPLRIASKLYLSHRHLLEDAKEREVIVRTFLALGSSLDLTGEDRKLLLSALFRSASAGLVKDDGGLSLMDLVASRSMGKD